MLAIYLVTFYDSTAQEAIDEVRQKIKGAIETTAQENAVREWEHYLKPYRPE